MTDNIPPARPPTELFDWKKVCPEDVARRYPPLAGPGRGRPLGEDAVRDARRKLQGRGLTAGEGKS